MDFDLQRHAEEEAVSTEESVETAEPIHEDLEGLSEETAREVMEEYGDAEEESAEADRDTKQYSPLDVPKQKVPYERFQKVTKANQKLEEEIAAYRARYGALNQQQPQQPQQPPPPPPPPQPQITKESAAEIKKAIDQQAMRLTGFSQEDVDALEYADDNDEDLIRWKTAKTLAQQQVYNSVQQAQIQRAQMINYYRQNHAQSTQSYNEFATKEMSGKDYRQIRDFATGEYFEKLPNATQQLISDAYTRIENQQASPQDYYCVQSYFGEAKAAYRKKYPARGGNTLKQRTTRIEQAGKLPRSAQLSGTTDESVVTVESLNEMLDTMPWDEIPKEYQDMLLGR